MIPRRSRGLWLLIFGLLTGLLALAGLTAVARASSPEKTASVSIALPVPYAAAVEAVRKVCADGLIRGTTQYESESSLSGARESDSSTAFPQWTGSGELFYKIRPGAISPSHFAGSKDVGEVTVRYVVAPESASSVNIRVDAVFVENSHHGRHASMGFVERAEFGEIAKLLKNSGPPASAPAAEASPTPAPKAASSQPVVQPDAPAAEAPRHVAAPVSLSPVPKAASPQPVVQPDPPAAAVAASQSALPERTYDRTELVLKTAMRELGAFESAPLPTLEGFANLDADSYPLYQRPQYQFRAEFTPAGPGKTAVRVEAVITARYTASGSRPEYRSVPSNGRLEADLFERLDGYLGVPAGATVSGAAGLRQQARKPIAKE